MEITFHTPPNHLREERVRRNWRQSDVAEQIGTTAVTVRRWEQGKQQPGAYFRLKLCTLFGKTVEELGLFHGRQFSSPVPAEGITAVVQVNDFEMEAPPLWTVPFARNPYFTGRDELLELLHSQLSPQIQDRPRHVTLTQTQVISGLGGIGKTQTAIEYAYRYIHEYTALFWAGAETSESLVSSFVTLAEILDLPVKQEHDQNKIVTDVLRWLAVHQGWLLIFDNVESLDVVKPFVPTVPHGSVLFTTRLQAVGNLAQQIKVETMGLAEGALFLLRRAKLLPADAFLDQVVPELLAEVESLVIEMDFLPLALDQAGAYIEEVGCDPSAYLELYQSRRKELLQRRGHTPSDHPDSVATTWSLSFQRIEQTNPAAADLLRMCAFLEPDAIPEEILREGCMTLGSLMQSVATNVLAFHEACEELYRFSLVQRDPQARLLRIHRLVQAVLKDHMEAAKQKRWVEHMIRATDVLFPTTVDATTWPLCQRLLPQAQMSSAWIENFEVASPQAVALLHRTAHYLRDVALYEQAKRLSQQVVSIRSRVLKREQVDMAHSLNELAEVYRQQGMYEEAEPLYRQAVLILEQQLGPDHSDVAFSLNGLANLYREQGKYAEANPLFQRALRIWEQSLGPEHPDVARPLNGLAILYKREGKYAEAEPLYQRMLHIWEQSLGPDHPDLAAPLYNLANLYQTQGKYEDAESLFQRALRIWERSLGPEHPNLAYALIGLADLYFQQGKYAEAEPLYQQTWHIWERSLGPEHTNLAYSLNGLANLYREQGRYTEAEPLFQRALRIRGQSLGSEHPDVARPLNGLAILYTEQGRYAEAEPLFQQAWGIREQSLEPDHPDWAYSLHGLANLYREQGRYAEAEPLYQRAMHIQEKQLGQNHYDTADTIHDFARFWEAQSNNEEARAWYARALAIREQALGAHHPKTTETRTRLIAVLHAMGQSKPSRLQENER